MIRKAKNEANDDDPVSDTQNGEKDDDLPRKPIKYHSFKKKSERVCANSRTVPENGWCQSLLKMWTLMFLSVFIAKHEHEYLS